MIFNFTLQQVLPEITTKNLVIFQSPFYHIIVIPHNRHPLDKGCTNKNLSFSNIIRHCLLFFISMLPFHLQKSF